jgi:ligand-binding sensor domain-containing protein
LKKNPAILILFSLVILQARSQPFSFSHLTTARGLSDNHVQCVTTDKNGFLWIGTANGLNRYDGYVVTTYNQLQQPELCSNDITNIFCDSRNRIWMGSTQGVTMIDEQRKFHKIIFNDSVKTKYSCAVIIETKSQGVVLFTNKGHYYLNVKDNKWISMPWSAARNFRTGRQDNAHFKAEQYVRIGNDTLFIIDYAKQKKVFELALPFAISACRSNNDEIIAASFKGKLFRISVSQKKIIKEYPLTRTENGRIINTDIVKVRQAANGQIIVATGLGGIMLFDPVTEKITRYTHDPLNLRSLSENSIDNIFCDAAGNVFISGQSQGLDYFNINTYSAGYIPAFTGANNEIYDGGINSIKEDDKGGLWLGGKNCLINWDPAGNGSTFYRYYFPIMDMGERPLQISIVCVDEKQRTWVSTKGGGIGVLNQVTGKFSTFARDTSNGKVPNLSNNFVDEIQQGPGGTLWLGSYTGLIQFNTGTYKYDEFVDHPVLKAAHQKRLWRIFTDRTGKLWLGFSKTGVYCYDKTNNELKHFSTKEGLLPGDVNALAEDDNGNMYVATTTGLSIIDKPGRIKTYTAANGLKYNTCMALVKDKAGNIWISNYNCILKFSPATQTFSYYDERSGLTGEDFRVNAACAAANGLLYWGTEKGIIYFDPARLNNAFSASEVLISQATIADSNHYFTKSSLFDLEHDRNSASFYFTSPDIYSNKNIIYQYRLTGLDKSWINSFDQRQVNYNSLSPGNYVFRVRTSHDGMNWKESMNQITLNILPAFWQTWWFKLLLFILIVVLIYYLFRRRVAAIREKEKTRTNYERKIAEVEMSSLRAQMNPHFMFNSLNSINNFILKNDPDNASDYLTKFSRLMRLILDNSRSEWVLLENELKALQLYIELEAVRFDNAFDYSIEVTQDVNPETVMVPPLIIQPYVENAIWHGLLHRKEPGGRIDIRLWKNNGTFYIEVEDNGVGRDEAKRLKSKTATKQKSHGMQITAQRIEVVNKVYNVGAGVTISDLGDKMGNSGTSVLISFKYKTHDSNNS